MLFRDVVPFYCFKSCTKQNSPHLTVITQMHPLVQKHVIQIIVNILVRFFSKLTWHCNCKVCPHQLQMGLLPLPRTQMTIVLVAKGLVLGVLTLLTFKNRGHLGSI